MELDFFDDFFEDWTTEEIIEYLYDEFGIEIIVS